MINFRQLTRYDDSYSLYCEAYSWDEENLCFPSKSDSELFGLFSNHFALYKDDVFIGFGMINYEIKINCRIKIFCDDSVKQQQKEEKAEPNKISLAYIINPSYRKQGYGSILLSNLVEYAKAKNQYDLITVEILKKNIASISLIEKHEFEFDYFDDEKIVFQKTLKNKYQSIE